jgi:hypothetical protein
MSLNPEKMKELKEKYNLSDEAIFEIASSLEPEPEEPETRTMGSRPAPTRASEEPLPMTLASAMKGDLSIAEAIILMDFMDRRERRDREGASPTSSSDIDRLIEKMDNRMEKMEEKIREDRASFEKLLLGKKIEETEERAKRSEEELKKREEEERQSKIAEDAFNKASEKYEPQLRELREKISILPANQQKSFWDEVFGEAADGIKQDLANQILKRLRGEEEKEVPTITDKEGKIVFNWEKFTKRLIDLGEKFLENRGQPPPKLPVKEVPPPFSESTESLGGEAPKIESESGDVTPIPEVGVREEEIATLRPALEEKVPEPAPESSAKPKPQPETEVVPETAPATEPPSEEKTPTATKKTGKGQARKG